MTSRRSLLKSLAATGALSALPPFAVAQNRPLFEISLAEWSLVSILRAGELSNLDFPGFARSEFGITAVEYVNQFWMDKAKDQDYLRELKMRCDDNGVRSVLIMCDREGNLGDPDATMRTQAIENHYKWADAAVYLGCHSIRVNAASSGTWEEQQQLAADGLRRLSEYGASLGIGVIVENHGGLSSNGQWLSAVIRDVGMDNCGTLPDFGNFNITRDERYNIYTGVQELMPFAKGVSAKSYAFTPDGIETTIDYERMLRIVLEAGYRGHIGVEWEGRDPDPVSGIKLTQALLEKLRDRLAADYT
jgi:L-ribulose-5-phosphate 3-epimerase